MNAPSLNIRKLLVFLIPATVFLGLYGLTLTNAFMQDTALLSRAITLDLLLLLPLVHLILIRKTKISKLTVVPLFIIALFLGYKIIPDDQHNWLDVFKNFVLPIVELGVLTLIIFKVRKMVKVYKSKSDHLDFYQALKIATSEVLPERISNVFLAEISAIYYAFFRWENKALRSNEFSYHKNSGTQALLFALILIVGVELLALHFLLINSVPLLAWVLSAISFYSAIQLFAFGKSLMARPYYLNKDTLMLNYGILAEAEIKIDNIKAVSELKMGVEIDEYKTLSPLKKLDQYNVLIEFNSSVELISIYGFKKQVDNLILFVDEKDEFISELINKIS